MRPSVGVDGALKPGETSGNDVVSLSLARIPAGGAPGDQEGRSTVFKLYHNKLPAAVRRDNRSFRAMVFGYQYIRAEVYVKQKAAVVRYLIRAW